MTDSPQRDRPDRPADTTRETPGERLADVLSEHRDDAPATDATGTTDPTPDPLDPFASGPAVEEDAGGQDDSQPDDGDDLPVAPLFALLRTLEEEVPAESIDRLWIFPPRRIEAGETAVVVVAALPQADPARRRVYAAHYTALDDSDHHRLTVTEYGSAPTDRVDRLVEEVVDRIKEGPASAPRSFRIQGDPLRWGQVLHELAGELLEEQRRRHRII
jgi:hypothetical protein